LKIKKTNPDESLILEQIYPNPFNSSTVINYSIPLASFETLKVYNVLGNEITSILSKKKPMGNHNVDFDASGFPSGIYFYKLQTSKFTQTKKMILLK